jgi:hypothetical protein
MGLPVTRRRMPLAGYVMRRIAPVIVGTVILVSHAVDAAMADSLIERVQYVRDARGSGPSIVRRANQGDPGAQAQLGFMYATGQGVPQHLGEAIYWYRRAAEQGDGRAQYLLGLSYDKGRGVIQDYVKAHMWLNLSAASARGDDREHKIRVRDAIASKMTFQQFVTAEQLALAWRPTRER